MQITQHTQTKSPVGDLQLNTHILEILKSRGHETDEQINEFFSWSLDELQTAPPLIDLDKASERIVEAIEQKETIAIYGDYDVDGTTSCALFYHFFDLIAVKVRTVQPSRFVEGYGLHISSIEDAMKVGVDLMITVDCGISNCESAEYALERGLDLIITDHHMDTKEQMPKAYAIVNPNRRDEPNPNPYQNLAGVGVAFMVCLKVRQLLMAKGFQVPSLYPLLQWVAVGTISDLAKLTSLNRRLVRHGLKQIPQTTYPGLNLFLNNDEKQKKLLPSEKISFGIGPYINSKGRLDHPEAALTLLTTHDHEVAMRNFREIEVSNFQRKDIQKEVFTEARAQVIKNNPHDSLINIVYAPHWHEGVIGIVASKLVETFKVPAIVFSNSEESGVIKASARSAGELNLFECLKECEDLFLKFGGHHAAAGLSMKKENLRALKQRLNEKLKSIPPIIRTVNIVADHYMDASEVNLDLIEQLQWLEPFGMGNELPLFALTGLRLERYQVLKDLHLKWFFQIQNPKQDAFALKNLSGISFFYQQQWSVPTPDEIQNHSQVSDLTVFCTLGINEFRGNRSIQLMVKEIRL